MNESIEVITKRSNTIRWRMKVAHSIADFFFNKVRFPGSRKLSRFISKIILPKLNSKINCPTIYGFDLVIDSDNMLDIYALGFYEAGTLNVIKYCLKEGDVFVDAGANIGLMSFYTSKLTGDLGKVIAFEPVSKYSDVIENSIVVNQTKNILLVKKGLGSVKQSVPIYLDRACPSVVLPGKEGGRTEIIEIEPLDDALASLGINEVKFLKVDVEGFEIEVLKGAHKLLASPNAPIICIEYIRKLIKSDSDNIINYLLKQNKYILFQPEHKSKISKLKKVESEKHLRDDDNVFCFLEKHFKDVNKNIFVN